MAGFGLGGRAFHAPFIAAGRRLQLTHVLQRRTRDAETLYPGVAIVGDFEALLEPSAGIDLVVITTPNPTHAPYALRALEAGKHVVVDKPFAVSLEEAERVIAAAASAGRVVAPFHNRRWDGDFCTVRTLIARGWLGRLQSLDSRLDRWRPEIRAERWKEQPGPGSGLLFDLGPHLVDQALALFGDPRAIRASVTAERSGSLVDDHFEITLDYSGLTVRLGAGMMAATPGPRFVLVGSAGQYVKTGVDPQEEQLRTGARPVGPEWGIEPAERWGTLAATIDGLHVEGRLRTLPGNYGGFYENVCDAIAGTRPLAVTPQAAARTIHLLHLARTSSERGGARLVI